MNLTTGEEKKYAYLYNIAMCCLYLLRICHKHCLTLIYKMIMHWLHLSYCGCFVLQKQGSTEELSAEMANLEGLMKDLTAITQDDFDC